MSLVLQDYWLLLEYLFQDSLHNLPFTLESIPINQKVLAIWKHLAFDSVFEIPKDKFIKALDYVMVFARDTQTRAKKGMVPNPIVPLNRKWPYIVSGFGSRNPVNSQMERILKNYKESSNSKIGVCAINFPNSLQETRSLPQYKSKEVKDIEENHICETTVSISP